MHPLVEQLKFARSEFARVFEGVPPGDATRRLLPMNCLSWIMAHLALQEQRYWITVAQGRDVIRHPELVELAGHPDRATTPELAVVREIWEGVTADADAYLDAVTDEMLGEHFIFDGERLPESAGTMLYRNIHHYWFHIGEAHAIRQQLGHSALPDFVGAQGSAPFRPGWSG